ncbi:MAG: ABC transporter ATP-binding protein [Herpetosiphonaceae bacterium]|nr:ABC transporter ATP-binding protein [Herpetosiphonaceae bacterium]
MHPPRTHYGSLLRDYVWPQRQRVVLLSGALLTSIALQIANPQVLRYFIDTAQQNAPTHLLIAAALLFLCGALLNQVATVAATYFSELVGWTATNNLRTQLLDHVLHLDRSFHADRTPGELIERIDGDVAALANFFSQFVIQIVGNLLLCAGVIVVVGVIDGWIALALAATSVVMFTLLLRLQRIAVPARLAGRQSSADLFGFIEERLGGTEDLRSNGAIPYTMLRLYQLMRRRLHLERRAAVRGAGAFTTTTVFSAVYVAIAFILIKRHVLLGTMTIGTAYLIFFYTQTLMHPITLISRQLEDFQKAAAGILRIDELLQIHSALSVGPGVPLPDGPLSVEFDNVSFGYDTDDAVLTSIGLSVGAGRVLGILGRTGSGKTTLTRLLFRLYDPTAGALRLGGVDLRDASLAELRERVGVVTQEVQLFHATIRENLTFFDDTISDRRILAVLDRLGLQAWYARLSHGLDTMLASGSSGGLSAGEAQVLALVRVFLKDPGLVILDEASSRLDPATEQLVEQAVDALLTGRTGLVIAHRLQTVLRADDILILENGGKAEYGRRTALQDDPTSRFSHLLRVGLDEVLV